MLALSVGKMNEIYKRVCEILKECEGDIGLFLQKTEHIECEDKAKILLKIGSVHIKENAEMRGVMEYALRCLEEQDAEMKIENAFLCALGYEKIKQYKYALKYYEYCMERLPDSAMKSAIQGMKHRVLSKAYNESKDYDLAIEAFTRATLEESVSWKKEKWEISAREMKAQKEHGWK